MPGSSEDDMFGSTISVKPRTQPDIASARPMASTTASTERYRFASPSVEEELIYRNWRRGVLTIYAVIACATAILIAIGSLDQSSTAQTGGCIFGVHSHCSERLPLVVNSQH